MTEQHLDARFLICPLPVLKARKVLAGLNDGDVLRISITDKSAPKDFQLFCTETGHVLKSIDDRGESVDVVVECRKVF
jgi:tRNA 2-thiouridine synthesizing protein A